MKVIGCTAHGKYQSCEFCGLKDRPQQCLDFKRRFNVHEKKE